MVMRKRPRHIRVHPKYFDFASNVRRELEPQFGRRVSDREITGSIIAFMEEERLDKIFMNRKKKKGGWL